MTKKKPRMGRPPKGDAALRAVVPVRVTEAEREEIEAAAKGRPLSEWARPVLVEAARRKS